MIGRIGQEVEATPARRLSKTITMDPRQSSTTGDSTAALATLEAILLSPVLRRRWIIQEANVARKAILLYGAWERDWQCLETVHRAVYKYALGVMDHATLSDQSMSLALQQGLAQINSLMTVKKLWREGTRFRHMELLYMFKSA